MAEIAERAGVALSTVSYVLSGKRPVSQKMRERVLAAIEELDYRPHGPARALASGASHTIALFLPSPQWQLAAGPADVRRRSHAGDERQRLRAAALHRRHRSGDDRAARRQRAGRRRDPDGDPARRPPGRAPPGGRLPVRADRTHARHDRDQLRRHGLRWRRRDEPGAPRAARAHLRRALQLPARSARGRLHGGADRAGRLRAARARARHPRHPHPLLARAARGIRGRGPATALRARLHRGDHDRLAVHRPAQRPARSRPPRSRRLLRRIGDRCPVRRDADARAHRRRVAGLRGGPVGGGDAHRQADGQERGAAAAPGLGGAHRPGVDRPRATDARLAGPRTGAARSAG